MRKTYNRAGLAVLALYGVMSAVSTAVIALFSGVGAVVLGLTDPDFLRVFDGGGMPDISNIYSLIASSDLFIFVILGMTAGTALGMFAGIKVMKKILPEKNNIPIPVQPLSGPDILIMILMAFGLWGVGAFVGNLPSWFGIDVPNPILGSRRPIMLVYYAYAIIGAPFFEELIFRKTLLRALHPYGESCAAFATALLFGLIHGNPAQFMLAFMIGILFASIYQRTGKIIYTMLLHFLINFTATVPDMLIMFIGHEELIATIWYIAVGSIVLAGAVILFVCRKRVFLAMSRSGNPNANREIFKNPGMRIAVIGGSILVGATELMNIYNCIESGFGTAVVLRVIPLCCSIVMIILTAVLVGKPLDRRLPVQEIEAPPLPEEKRDSEPVITEEKPL